MTLPAPATESAPPKFSSALEPAPTPPIVRAHIEPLEEASTLTCPADITSEEEIYDRVSLSRTLTAKDPPNDAATADVLPTAAETPTTTALAFISALSSAESLTAPTPEVTCRSVDSLDM